MPDWYDRAADTAWVKPGMIIRIGRNPTNPHDFELLLRVRRITPDGWPVDCYTSNNFGRTTFTWYLPIGFCWQVRDESDWALAVLMDRWEPPADDVAPEHDDAA